MASHRPRIQPGQEVECRAYRFNHQWAKETFGRKWRDAWVHGVVQSAVGPGSWMVLWDGDEQAYESQRSHLRIVARRGPPESAHDIATEEYDDPDGGAGAAGGHSATEDEDDDLWSPKRDGDPETDADGDDEDEDEEVVEHTAHGAVWEKVESVTQRPATASRSVRKMAPHAAPML